MHQQLAAWGRQAACVRAGNLQLSCELGGTNQVGHARLSPGADRVATQSLTGRRSVAVLRVTGAQHDLVSLQAAALPSQTLTPPGSGRGQVLGFQWRLTGLHLAVVTPESSAACCGVRVSTYRGAQLVGSFVEPLAEREHYHSLHLSDDAATMLLCVLSHSKQHCLRAYQSLLRVLACTVQGTVTARHLSAPTAQHAAALGNGRLLTVPTSGESLCIYSASCAAQISLQRCPAQCSEVLHSAYGATASVLLLSWDGAHTLVVVDLARCCVLCCVDVQDGSYEPETWSVAQGAHSVALVLEDLQQVVVFATSGEQLGQELFRSGGHAAAWDGMGRFLAVARQQEGVVVLDAASWMPVASWEMDAKAVPDSSPATSSASSLRWLPDSSGLAVLKSQWSSPAGADPADTSKYILVYNGVC